MDGINNAQNEDCFTVNLYDIVKDYREKILNMVNKMKSKIVVFDFDGTLTEFKYAEKTLLPCKEDELYEYSKTSSIYENAKVLKTMQYILSKLDSKDVYIVTSTRKTLVKSKEEFIAKSFPMVEKKHIIHTDGAKEKVQVIKDLHNKYNKDMIFVEDMASTIQLVDEDDTIDYVYGIHISSFLV